MADSALTLTRAYDAWLGKAIPLDTAELDRKHAEMAAHGYRFLRGSYFLWLDRIATGLPELLSRATVPLVGDLHVENFGTWRDRDQIRRWGVNDLDELARGPWLLDLLRLAVSAVLAPHIALDDHRIVQLVLDAWRDAKPGPSAELGKKRSAHLARLVPEPAGRSAFYADLVTGAAAEPPAAVVRAASATVPDGWQSGWHRRKAGTGSLGHRRFVGVGPADDGKQHAREVKELGPATVLWVKQRHPDLTLPTGRVDYAHVIAAVRGPAAATRVDGWQVRDLAPDVLRVELAGLAPRDVVEVLTDMAAATADVHGSDPVAHRAARHEAEALGHKDFRALVEEMTARTREDHAAFRSALGD